MPEHPKARVLIAVPFEVERAGLRLFIEADPQFQVVAEASQGQTALALARAIEPDIALIDGSISDVPALGLVHFLSHSCPGTQVLLYSDRCSRDWIEAALREGVRAFVMKAQVRKHLGPALRALADNRPYWEDAIDDALLDELLERTPNPAEGILTSREWQVLQMSAEGRTAKEMAKSLGLSHRTVECHRATLRRKLGFRRKAELIRYVAQHDLGD
jgi:DNA-binding NarL/FixJ family response regulator